MNELEQYKAIVKQLKPFTQKIPNLYLEEDVLDYLKDLRLCKDCIINKENNE